MNNFRDFGPVPWWAWTGAMEFSEMKRQIDFMKSQHIDEFFIFALYGLEKPEFLSEEWFEYLKFTLDYCQKLDMKVWIYDDLNWPSGSAGGKLLRDYPECRCKSMVMSTLDCGELFNQEKFPQPYKLFVGNKDRGYRQESEEKLTQRVAKDENILIFELKYTNMQLLNTLGTNYSRGERGYFDILNEKSVRCWMNYIHEEYRKRFSHYFGSTLRGFFFDEPFSTHPKVFGPKRQNIPWTTGFSQKFFELHNYNVDDLLPIIFLDSTINQPQTVQVRSDYWSLVSELGGKGIGLINQWCKKYNLLSTGHCVFEELVNQHHKLVGSPSMFDILKHHSAPGMDLLGAITPYYTASDNLWYGSIDQVEKQFTITAKSLTSTARYSPNAQRTMAEAFGLRSWGGLPVEQKIVNDFLAAMGVNLINDNSLIYSINGFRKRGISGKHFTQPYYKMYHHFSEYSRNLSTFAAFGHLDTSIAVLIPETTLRTCTAASFDEDIPSTGDCSVIPAQLTDTLLKNQLDFELIFPSILETAKVVPHTLIVPNAQFNVIFIPRPTTLTLKEFRKLMEFSNAGGFVVFVGNRPKFIIGLSKLSQFESKWLDEVLLINEDTVLSEYFGEYLIDLIKKQITLKYEITCEKNHHLLSALRGDGKINQLLLANQSDEELVLSLKWPAKNLVKLFEPSLNQTILLPSNSGEEISISLQSYQTIILTDSSDLFNDIPISTNTKILDYANVAKQPTTLLNANWDYELSEKNIAQICFQLGLMNRDGEISFDTTVSANGYYDMQLVSEQYEFFYLEGEFEINMDIPQDLSIICDDDNIVEISLNGTILSECSKYELWDHHNLSYKANFAVKQGVNTLRLKVKTVWSNRNSFNRIFADNYIEPVVIAGNFGVEFKERKTRLFPLPPKLHIGDISEQGLPQYIGLIKYYQHFDLSEEEYKNSMHFLECQKANASLGCSCNGTFIDEKLWGPYTFDLSDVLQIGNNYLELEVATTLGNLLRYAYDGRLRPKVACGLLAQVEII